jgi:hypothetical protein
MSDQNPSTPNASAEPAEESRLLESQAELEIQENPRLSQKEGLAPSEAADAHDPARQGSANASVGASGTPSTSAADEPELANEEDVPLDGRDHEGERMIEQLAQEPHLRQPLEGK